MWNKKQTEAIKKINQIVCGKTTTHVMMHHIYEQFLYLAICDRWFVW
jgi:hypothetical protein